MKYPLITGFGPSIVFYTLLLIGLRAVLFYLATPNLPKGRALSAQRPGFVCSLF